MKRRSTKLGLVESFKEASTNHFKASVAGDYRNANRQAKTIKKAFQELRGMGDEGYQALMTLLENENKAVATMAAAYLLRYATTAAMQVLNRYAQEDKGLIGFGAQQALERWREGDWHLDE